MQISLYFQKHVQDFAQIFNYGEHIMLMAWNNNVNHEWEK